MFSRKQNNIVDCQIHIICYTTLCYATLIIKRNDKIDMCSVYGDITSYRKYSHIFLQRRRRQQYFIFSFFCLPCYIYENFISQKEVSGTYA